MTVVSLTARATLVVLAGALFGPLAIPVTAMAADDDGALTWGVQPSTPEGPDGRSAFDFQVAPGTQISDWAAVTNDSTVAATFRVYAADATTDYDTAAFTLIGADQASSDVGAWTSIDSTAAVCPDTNDQAEAECARGLGERVTLQPGERANLPFTITVPADATPGDHAAGIVASYEQRTTDATGSAVQVEQRVGTRIYLRIDGPLAASVGISGVVAGYDGSPNPVAPGTARVGFDVTNTGNVRLSGTPQVHLSGPFGIDLGSVTLDPVANLMPGGTGHVTATLPDVPALVFLRATVTVSPLPGDGATGQADLGLTPVTGSAVAWAMPWTAIGLLVALVAIVVLVVWWRRRSRSLLAAELAAYTEQVRAEARALSAADLSAADLSSSSESETPR